MCTAYTKFAIRYLSLKASTVWFTFVGDNEKFVKLLPNKFFDRKMIDLDFVPVK